MDVPEQLNGFNVNARYDTGPNAAGCGRFSPPVWNAGDLGLAADGHVYNTNLRVGHNVAGAPREGNTGPNVAGNPKAPSTPADELV